MTAQSRRSTPKSVLFGALFSIFFLFGASDTQVQAQVANLDEITRQEVGLTAIPPRMGDDGSLEVQPGELVQTEVRVRNTTSQVQTVRTVVEDFIIGEDGKTPIPVVGNEDSRWSLASWIEIPNETTLLPAGVSQTVPVFIRVPDDALPGGRYAMIMHQPIGNDQVSLSTTELGGQAAVNQRVGTLVYIRVAGEVHEEAHLRNISIPSFTEFGPVGISFDIENLSDIHVQPITQIRISNMFGTEVEEIKVEAQNVFPYSLRSFQTQWDRVWGYGRYTAQFLVVYGSEGETVAATYHFWLFPYKLVITLFVVLIALLGIFISIRRHLYHRNDVTSQHVSLLEDRIRQLENELQEHE